MYERTLYVFELVVEDEYAFKHSSKFPHWPRIEANKGNILKTHIFINILT